MLYSDITHSEEERELPAVEADPEELGLQALLLHDVVVIGRLHFLQVKVAGGRLWDLIINMSLSY